MGFMLRLFRATRRLLLPAGVARSNEAEVVKTAQALAADAARRGRRATLGYWRAEFLSLSRAAVAARRRDPSLPDDLFPTPRRHFMLSSLRQDVRYAIRLLRRTPGFTAVAVVTLALGIGANTAIFSLIHGVLLTPLPYPQSDRLVRLLHRDMTDPSALGSITPGNFYDLQRSASLQPLSAVNGITRTLTGRGEPQTLAGMRSTGSVLEVLGVAPAAGRIFTAGDDQPGAAPVVVISHPTSQRLFGSAAAALGESLVLNGQAFTVIGVMPAGFQFPTPDVEFWAPAQFPAPLRASRDQFMLAGIGRLADGRSLGEADAEMQTLMARLRTDHPQANSNVAMSLQPLHEALVGTTRTPLWILMGSVACVLLIACTNLANLMLARAVHRRREIAVRQAIGAGRAQVVRQLLTESLVLGVAGGAAGLATGYVFLRALLAWLPEGTPRLTDVSMNPAVFLFTLGVAVVSSLFFGLAPALQLSGSAPAPALKDTAASTTARSRLRPALVVAEIAIALVLLTGAGLLLRSFQALQQVNPGFSEGRALTFRVNLAGASYPRAEPRLAFVQRAIEELRSLPGVASVAAGSNVPLAGRGTGAWFNIIDRPLAPGVTPPGVPYRVITPDYFRTLGIPLVRGRLLVDSDGLDGTPSVVISESTARRFFPGDGGGEAIGRDIYLGAPDNRLFDRATIVGIVADVKLAGLDSGITEAVYGTQSLMPWWTSFTFVVRTNGDPAQLVASARQRIRRLDPAMPVAAVQTMDEITRASVAPARSSMLLLTLFAGVALAMAAVGVFGVLSFNVTRRSRELGIRMALGADPGSLRALVVREGMAQAVAGIAFGLAGAFWLTTFMSSLLFEVPARDPLTFAGASLVLAAVAAAACYLPARRATRIDPLLVLRAE